MNQPGMPTKQLTPEPVIVGFLCSWCAYRAADLVGMSRGETVPNIRSIRVMCSGRVEPALFLKAFCQGADGVLVAGCHPGECHYADGNVKALCRVTLMQEMLPQWGIEKERLQIVWAAASEGSLFSEAAARMTEELRALGPLGYGTAGPMDDALFGDLMKHIEESDNTEVGEECDLS